MFRFADIGQIFSEIATILFSTIIFIKSYKQFLNQF